jgi:hypothetical protein
MPDGEHAIDSYLTHLGRRLHLPAAERDQVLAEVRGHLEERARALRATGVSEEQAERQAVLAFGPVGRISQELRVSHPVAWGKRRWMVGMLMGAVVFYALYLVETVPLVIYYFSAHHLSLLPLPPVVIWDWSSGSMLGYLGLTFVYSKLFFVWLLLPFFVLYPILPLRWGRRAQRWWVPGLAYGLGTCLLVLVDLFNRALFDVIVFKAGFLGPDVIHMDIIPFVWVAAVALPLALAASFVGWWWRERSASALGRAQAA